MIFNSVQFGLFFIVVLALYWSLRHRQRNLLLLVASYFFYGMWDWRFLSLIAISTVVDYVIGRRMPTTTGSPKTALLVTSMVVNLGILGTFKYAGFFVDGFEELVSFVGFGVSGPVLDLVLPVGISFYTFQTMSYTIDVYRGRLEPVDDFLTFATFVAYFPQLVAGPIERARDLLPQLIAPRPPLRVEQITSGLGLVLLGLTKKVVLADGVAGVADRAFESPGQLSWLAVTAGVVAFGIQIYGDFSGYTDIARGVSRLLGIELTLNFAQPYLSRNITEFWRRWHITLSNWLRDYLYIPLGGNRRGRHRTHVNLMITMLLGGLWHGASWNFVIWGGIHGALLVLHRVLRGGRVPTAPISRRDIPAILATSGAVFVAWVFFRAPDLATALDVFQAMAFQSGAQATGDLLLVAVFLVAMVAIDLFARKGAITGRVVLTRPALSGSLVAASLVAITLFSGGAPRPFVYFQF